MKVTHSCKLLMLSVLALGGCKPTPSEHQQGNAVDAEVKSTSSHGHEEKIAKYSDDLWLPVNSEVKLDPSVESQITDIMADMTLEHKIAQMMQPEIRDITPQDMKKYGFGSYLNGGGAFPDNNKQSTPQDWIALAEAMYQASVDDSEDGSNIPTMWGTDAVHGHNNVIGATLFPHNIGLGAANNPELIEKIAKVTATEVMVTGIDWVFAPTVATVRNDRWGRTYEGYSEDPEIVKAYAGAIVKGLQGQAGKDFLGDDRVISTVKHFVGDGGTVDGDDQGNNIASEHDLYHIHAQGYVSGLQAGSQSVMASFNRWKGDKIHGNKYLLTTVLKEKMGFDGFVVGDWNGHGQVAGCTNESCPQAINAGLDIFMVPTGAWKPLYENTLAQAEQGIIPMSRIDDAVRRILRVKLRAGLFTKPSPKNRAFSGKTSLIGQMEHRKIAQQAVRESLVLLKNSNALLPLSPNQRILVAGDAADNIGKQSGGWTITWQGTNNTNADFPGGSSIYRGIEGAVTSAGGSTELSITGDYSQTPDLAIVVFGEEPYAEGQGDVDNVDYKPTKDLELLRKLKADGIPVVSVFITGRPLWVNAELNASDAFVVAWLPGSEGAALSDVLFSTPQGAINYDFTGKLSFSWPRYADQTEVNRGDTDYNPLYPYGYGLTYLDSDTTSDSLSEVGIEGDDSLSVITIHNGGVKAPFSMALVAGEQVKNIQASTAELAGAEFRTIDRVVQEDGFRVSIDGEQSAGIRFSALQTEQVNLNNNYKLVFSIQPLADVSGPLTLSMGCKTAGSIDKSCAASIDISSILASNPQGEWQSMAIDLQCFINKGADFSQPDTVLELTSKAPVSFMLHDINLVPRQEGETVTCP